MLSILNLKIPNPTTFIPPVLTVVQGQMLPNVEIRLIVLGQLPRAVQHRLRKLVQLPQSLVAGIAVIRLDDDRWTSVLLWIELCANDGSRETGPATDGDEFVRRQFTVGTAVEDVVDDVDVHWMLC
jgi:hypothetical protein